MALSRENLIETLKSFGLSDKEAKVYLASLDLGPSAVLKIANFSNLKRATVYVIIDSLSKKGLMSIEVRGFKKIYKAESPDRLEAILNNRKEELLKTLPALNEIYSKEKSDSFIRYYEGLNAIKLAYEELLDIVKPGDYYLVIGNQEDWFYSDQKFFLKFMEKRAKLGADLRLLLEDAPITREHKKHQQNWKEKVKILPQGTTITANLVITPKRLIIHSLTGPMIAIVIENSNVSKTNKEMFEIIWRALL